MDLTDRHLIDNVPSVEAKLLEAPCSDDCYKLGKAAVNADWDEYDHKFLRAHCNESVTADACDVALQLDRPCSFVRRTFSFSAFET